MKAIATQIRHTMWGGQKLEPYPKTMNYPDILEAAWQDHLKPKAPNAPTVISLFAGGGGSSLGYSMAGYRELLAVEWDDNAVATFKLNFPDIPVYHGDIAKLSVEECMTLAGLTEPGQLDLLDGSPPCQGFSSAGKRILDDPRNQLFREYVRLLRGLKPKVFVMENVSGLVKGKMKLVFAEIMRELKASGYQVKCQLMNAKYFYVPQSRERLIFIGIRNDLGIEPSHPKAERITFLRDAIENIDNKTFSPLDLSVPFSFVLPGKSVRQCCPKEILKEYFPRFVNNKRFNFNSYAKRQLWQRPSQTIEKTYMNVCPIHPSDNRHYTIEELKRIGSFPDRFEFIGAYRVQWERIGNSVPPLFMRSIALHVKDTCFVNKQLHLSPESGLFA